MLSDTLRAGYCPQAMDFFRRAPTLPANYRQDYDRLIRTLVQLGIWAKLDALYVFATYDTASALVNLVSSSFALTANGGPTFAQNAGYTGVDASTTVYLNTGFNPSTATNPKFTRNSAHMSAWVATDVAAGGSGGVVIGQFDGVSVETDLLPHYIDGFTYFRCNDAGGSAGVTPTAYTGHMVSTRTGASTQEGYVSSVAQGVVSATSGAVVNNNMAILGRNSNGTNDSGAGNQVAAASIGGGLTQGNVSGFYSALRFFMTQRGVA